MRSHSEDTAMDVSNGSKWRMAGVCGLLAFALALALGCDRNAQDSKPRQNMPTSQAKVEANEAEGGAAESVAIQRRRLQEQAEETRDDIELELSDARRELAALQAAIDRGESAQKALAMEIEDCQRPSADPWEKTKARLSGARDEAAEAQREIAALLAGHERKTGER